MAKKSESNSVAAMAAAVSGRKIAESEVQNSPSDFDGPVNSQEAKNIPPLDATSGTVLIEFPFDSEPAPAFRLHIDMHLQGETAAAFRRFVNGLDSQNIRLKNGRLPSGANDAVRWIAEQLANGKPA